MDRHWLDWCSFLEGRGSCSSDFSLADLIAFASLWSSEVSAGSQSLAAASLSTTYEMAFGVNLIDLGGAAFKFSKRSSKTLAFRTAKPSRKSRIVHTEDTLIYVAHFCGLPDNQDLAIEILSLKVLVLLRMLAFRSIDLFAMPAGEGAGYRIRDGKIEIRSYMTKTAKSNKDLDRQGWTDWSSIPKIDVHRVSQAWAALGIPLGDPSKVCVFRALSCWLSRMAPVWAEFGEGFAGITCDARSCFTHINPVQSGRLMLASNNLLASQVRNFHNRLFENPIPGVPPLERRMGLKSGPTSISPGLLRHCAVSKLLFLDRVSECLNLTRHASISTSRDHYLLPLADSLRSRLGTLKTEHSFLCESLSASELLLVLSSGYNGDTKGF